MSMFKYPLERVNNIENNFNNFSQATEIKIQEIINNQTNLATIPVHLINDKVLINNGVIELSRKPLSSALINNMVMVVQEIGNDLVVQAEIIKPFSIVENVVNLETTFYNGYYALVSYIYQGEL